MSNSNINWSAVSAVGTCLGAMATFCACLIALWQTRYDNRKKIKIYFNDSVILVHPKILSEEQKFVGVTIINEGNRPVNVTEWAFELKSDKRCIIILNYNKPYLTQLPILIEPEQKAELYYERAFFEQNIFSFIQKDPMYQNKKIKFSIRDATGRSYIFHSKKKAKAYMEKKE